MSISKVLIAGVGTMGQQIGWQCALHGFDVVMFNLRQPSLDTCRKAQREFADLFHREKGQSSDAVAAALARISYTTDLAKAGADADIVSESIIEDPDAKHSIYKALNECCPAKTIFTTNSSTLLPSQIAASTGRPEKFMALHFVVGVWEANVAEVMAHPGTTAETVDTVVAFAKAIGMVPIHIGREQSGYIVNSLLIPWAVAAQSLVTNGVATPQDIDKTWMITTQMRMGPFGLMDAVGLGTVTTIFKALSAQSGDDLARRNAAYLEDNFVLRGKLGVKSGEGYYSYPEPDYQRPDFLS
ncbi:MAG: 3-hydroxyacyl-CoA dehydrogenase [Halioglobus sp.]|nr:3-hydroxyacyl-CoA dehydrogenase [Halioglobus sp.]